MFLPDYVKNIIYTLESAGFEAYAVGGCVRDALLGLKPDDYDVTTSATPDEVKTAFQDRAYSIHDTGLKHGTVTVVSTAEQKSLPVEVTTFRIDGCYNDNRHPDSVTFTRSLRDDLSRRDFTVNAMAFSEKTGIVDHFNGREDLKNKIIRTVGEPYKRFNEDGLRILRALRFAAVYGFSVEPDTAAVIHRLCGLLDNISGERIAQEINKLILGRVSEIIYRYADVFSRFMPEIIICKDFDQRSIYHDRDVLTHSLNAVDNSPADRIVRLAMLFHDLGKPSSFLLEDGHGHFKGHSRKSEEITRRIMRGLKYDNDTFYKVVTLVKFHDIPINPEVKAVKRLLNRFGEEQFFRLIEVHTADDSAKTPELQKRIPSFKKAADIARRIIEEQQCFSLKQLAVKGGDLVELGYKGRETGVALNVLLQAVIGEKCANNKEELLKFLIRGRNGHKL